ncbi:MAG: polyprenyl synthetase family protein [Acidobacteria bacterium]|nr:polyprenyl synthetase family protein [Acidobacteriota bacterium]MDA1235302.1 polyprenyl synthetase family protein [Acidobacteriota bacterium]
MTLGEYLEKQRSAIDAELDRLTPTADERPQTLHRAMRHSLMAGGKRLRPILFCAASEAVGRTAGALTPACALEFIHTYSLIHDDLPALDNDDFRRGQPTCHKTFGEATAILAGDALLTRAFQVLAEAEHVHAAVQIAMISELATSAGTVDGMIGGQMEDLEAEGRPVDSERLHYIHRSKTGALIRAAVRLGGMFGEASSEELDRLSDYGSAIGTAFQIVDDILDVEGTTESLGKTAGKDAQQQKATYPALYGLEHSKELAAKQLSLALAAVATFGEAGDRLRGIAETIVSRSA